MNKEIKYVFVFIILLLFSISMVAAVDVNETTDSAYSETFKEDSIIFDENNMEYVAYDNENLIKDKNIAKNTQKITKKSENTIIFNSTTFDTYVTNNQLNDNVDDGDTLDFQGIMFGERFKLTVNKPVNIISSTNDAFYGNDKELGFTINQGGSGTNLTNVHFYNTHLVVYNATNVIIDNVTVEVQHCIVGAGQGVTSIREESSNVLVSNSYFLSNDTGGVSTLVCAGAQNVRLENNTVIAKNMVGNLVYFTTYNLNTKKGNENITLINTYIDGTDAISQSICVPLVIQGKNHRIINNTIRHNTTGISWTVMAQMVSGPGGIEDMIHDENSVVGNLFINNSIVGNFSLSNLFISGNKLEHISVKNSVVTNNEIGTLIVKGNTTCYDNSVKDLIINANDNNVTDNDYVNLIINSTNNTIQNNRGWYIIDENNRDDYNRIGNDLVIDNSDIADENILFDLDDSYVKFIKLNDLSNKNLRFISPVDGIVVSGNNISIIDAILPESLLTIGENSNITLINSTFLEAYLKNNAHIDEVNTNIITDENNQLLSKKDELNNFNPKEYQDFFDTTTHKIHDSINENTNIIIKNALNGEKFTQPIIIDKKINITGLNKAQWDGDIIFNKGSEGSCLTNMIINATIYINTSNIHITNNTINKQIIIENSNNNQINNNNINTTETAIIMINTTKTEITENNISTTATNTITLDGKSHENTITNNFLISNGYNSSHTINGNDNNIINHNKPEQNTTLSIQISPNTKRNVPTVMNITLISNDENVTNGVLYILANGIENKKIVLNNQSILQTTLELDEIGENKIKVLYFPTDIYSKATATNKTTVTPVESYVDVQISPTRINENSTVIVTLTDEYGNVINEGIVILSIQNFTSASEIINGTATIIVPGLEEYKGRTLTVTYPGTRNIANLTTSTTFNLLKGESNIELLGQMDGDNVIITATATNILGEKIDKGYVQFKAPKLTKLVKIENEKAVLTIPMPTSDTTINATFRNNQNYEEATTNITIITTKDTNIIINPLNAVYFGQNMTITGILTDNESTLKNRLISFKINDDMVELITDDEGIFTYTLQATKVGTNNITATYAGDNNYKLSTAQTTFVVEKQNTKTTITPISSVTYGDNVTINGKLTDNSGKAMTATHVELTVNTNAVGLTTDSNGVFTYTTTVSTVGTNDVTVSYAGNSNYKASGAKATFTVSKQNTTLTISSVKTDENKVTVTGTLTDKNNNIIKNAPVSLTINKNGVNVTTDNNGIFTYNGNVQLETINNLTAIFAGNNYYNPSTTKISFNKNIQDTKITINNIPSTTYTRNITVTGKLTDKNNNILKNMPIILKINNDEINLTTNNNGIYTYTNRTPTAGTNNVTVTYHGNKDYNPTSTTTTFTVNKQDLKIIIDSIKTVTYGHDVTITGKFVDGDGNLRANVALRIYINGKSVSTRTDANGNFNISSKVGVIGTNNVTSNHTGDKNFNPTTPKTTFKMQKQDLIITVDKIPDVIYGSKVNITGTLKDGDGTLRANTGVKILINGKSATAKTDKNGKYTFTTKIGKLGTNNVTVSHAGGANYNPTSASTTYKVVKQDLKITLDKIGTVTYGSVTIKGRFTDSNYNPRANTGLKVSINGKTATAKTDKDGYFTLTTKVGVVGVNNVTAYHQGGGNYNPVNTTTTFTMKKQDLKVTIDPISTVTYGNNVVITGTFTDGSGKVRANSAIKIIINGKTLTTRTDKNGKFRATSKVGSVGTNNVTVAHSGGTGFNPTSTNTTFKMIKQDLKITINPINTTKKGNTLTVTGTFTDGNGKIRANTNLKVNLNGKEYTTKTDNKGTFTYTTKATTVGSNTITISHNGGGNYNPTNTTAKFTVTN